MIKLVFALVFFVGYLSATPIIVQSISAEDIDLKKAACGLLDTINRNEGEEKIVKFIEEHIPEKFRNKFTDILVKEGVHKLREFAEKKCREEVVAQEIDLKKAACGLLDTINRNEGEEIIVKFIQEHIPEKFRNTFTDILVKEGVHKLREFAEKKCRGEEVSSPKIDLKKAACGLLDTINRNQGEELIVKFIQEHIPEKYRNKFTEVLVKEGVHKLRELAEKACRGEEIQTAEIDLKKAACGLLDAINRNQGEELIVKFIQEHIPEKYRNKFTEVLVKEGIHKLRELAEKHCRE